MLKNNKILLIVLLSIIFLLVFCTSKVNAVSASALPTELNNLLVNNSYYNNPDYDYLVYHWDDYYSILFIEKDNSLKCFAQTKNIYGFWFLFNKTFDGYLYIYDSSFNLTNSITVVDASWLNAYDGGFVSNDLVFLSSFNIYTDNTFTDIFYLNNNSRLQAIIDYWHSNYNTTYSDIIVLNTYEFILFNNVSGNKFYISDSDDPSSFWLCSIENLPNNLFSCDGSGNIAFTTNVIEFGTGPCHYLISGVLYSSVDIYDDYFLTDYFFQVPPQEIAEAQGVLAPIVEEVETNKVVEEILLLLPIIMIVLISLIAFRKVWAWLKRSLRS